MSEKIKLVFGKGLDMVTVELTRAEAKRLHEQLNRFVNQSDTAKAALAVDASRKG